MFVEFLSEQLDEGSFERQVFGWFRESYSGRLVARDLVKSWIKGWERALEVSRGLVFGCVKCLTICYVSERFGER